MKLIYQPEGAERREIDFIPQKLMSPETEAIERVGRGGWWDSFEEFGVYFMKGNSRAKRAALWIMLKRENPMLKFDELSVTMETLLVEFGDEEKRQIRDAIAADPEMDPDERQVYLDQIDSELFDGENPLVVPSPNSEADDSTSPTPDSPPASGNSTAGL